MCFKGNDEFSSLTTEHKKDIAKEAELLSKIYGWFNDIANANKSTTAEIHDHGLYKNGKLTPDEAKNIESRTKESGLSDLVNKHKKVSDKIKNGNKKLSKLWPKIIANLTTQ